VTWLPSPRETAAEYEKRKADFIALYGEDLWNQIQDLSKPKPLAEREVFKPRRPPEPPENIDDVGDPDDYETRYP